MEAACAGAKERDVKTNEEVQLGVALNKRRRKRAREKNEGKKKENGEMAESL